MGKGEKKSEVKKRYGQKKCHFYGFIFLSIF